ncbi:MAG TPA: LacI family DNA-binding transcriptional regulator, partial [Agromyces sp.]
MAVSVREVAAAASVSVGTVSNVLNRPDKVAPATVERVLAAIEELGFVRNDAARQLRAGRSRSIGFVVLDVRNPFFTEVARGAETRAADAGLTVLLGTSDESIERERVYVDLFEEQRVHGVLISPLADDLPRLQRLRDRGTPVVLVDRQVHDRSFSSVSVDDVAGGRLAAEHLL